MESSNFYQLLQPQIAGSSSSSSSSLSAPSNYGDVSPHVWTHNIALSNGNPHGDGTAENPRQKNEPPINNSVIQEMGFHYNINGNNAVTVSLTNHHEHELRRIKEEEEQLLYSFPKLTDILNNTSTTTEPNPHLSSTSYFKDDQKYMADLSQKLLLKTISSGFPISGHHQFSQSYSSFGSRGSFSQIYPSVNVSNFYEPSTPASISGSVDMNLQTFDLLTSTRFSGCFSHTSDDNPGVYRDNSSCDLDRLQQSSHLPPCSTSKVSSFPTNEITEAKRPSSSFIEPKTNIQAAPKKSRLQSRPSSPPFKVRKEKLGDRIAALQQLVAPFGKTDTASVLMEAIGYIKFLQNQVETLSVPYMKSSLNKNSRNMQAGRIMEEGNNEPKKDLRSRGLCLVPLSCMSYVTGDGDGSSRAIWPLPPNFCGT